MMRCLRFERIAWLPLALCGAFAARAEPETWSRPPGTIVDAYRVVRETPLYADFRERDATDPACIARAPDWPFGSSADDVTWQYLDLNGDGRPELSLTVGSVRCEGPLFILQSSPYAPYWHVICATTGFLPGDGAVLLPQRSHGWRWFRTKRPYRWRRTAQGVTCEPNGPYRDLDIVPMLREDLRPIRKWYSLGGDILRALRRSFSPIAARIGTGNGPEPDWRHSVDPFMHVESAGTFLGRAEFHTGFKRIVSPLVCQDGLCPVFAQSVDVPGSPLSCEIYAPWDADLEAIPGDEQPWPFRLGRQRYGWRPAPDGQAGFVCALEPPPG